MKKTKNILSLLAVICILICAMGCGNAENGKTTDKSVNTDYTAEIEGLKQEVAEMSEAVQSAEKTIEGLQKEVKSLESENSALKKSIKDVDSSTQKIKYTITKKELIGEWEGIRMLDKHDTPRTTGWELKFTEKNILAINGNVIIYKWHDEIDYVIEYVYYDGYLYDSTHDRIYRRK